MKLDTIAVLGGGPGGLYAARLLKLSHPQATVTVYEQGVPSETFGFGVGLASRTQRNLRSADAASFDAIVDAALPHEMSMKIGSDEVRLAHGELLAIGRATLLAVLQRFAAQAGVELRYGQRRTVTELDADLIVAADGINSATRSEFAADFGPHIAEGEGLYLWCGTDFQLPSAVFTPATTDHGTFVAHAYPYAADRSTFLIETDEETFKRAGFDVSTEQTPAGETDSTSLAYLQGAFADTLQGHQLIGNRTKWLRFRTVRCDAWHIRNVVLLGDAAHTAHYSIGSGTKLAMEDAIALDQALLANEDLTSAFAEYETRRRGPVEHLQSIAERSMAWWDRFPERIQMPVSQLMVAYMTRAGKVSLQRFAESAGPIVRTGLAEFAGCTPDDVPEPDQLTDWVLDQMPQQLDGHETRLAITDRPWSVEIRKLVADLSDTDAYRLTGADDRDAVLDRLDVAEQIRRGGRRVTVEVPATLRADAAAALAVERVDGVLFTGVGLT